jgi:hypothetical protein
MVSSIGRSSRGRRAVLLENMLASVRTLVNAGCIPAPAVSTGPFFVGLRAFACAK